MQHKAFCKAVHQIENDTFSKNILMFSLADIPNKLDDLNMFVDERAQNISRLCQFIMKRPPSVMERNLIGWEPRCQAW